MGELRTLAVKRPACACGRPLGVRAPEDPEMAKKCGVCRALADDPSLKKMRPGRRPTRGPAGR